MGLGDGELNVVVVYVKEVRLVVLAGARPGPLPLHPLIVEVVAGVVILRHLPEQLVIEQLAVVQRVAGLHGDQEPHHPAHQQRHGEGDGQAWHGGMSLDIRGAQRCAVQ